MGSKLVTFQIHTCWVRGSPGLGALPLPSALRSWKDASRVEIKANKHKNLSQVWWCSCAVPAFGEGGAAGSGVGSLLGLHREVSLSQWEIPL